MTVSNHYNINNSFQPSFLAKKEVSVATPMEGVQKSLEQGVDNLATKINEKKDKKSTKTAIAVGSSVLLLAALVTVFNPRYSPKLMKKIKALQQQAAVQIEKNKNDYFKSKFYSGYKTALDWTAKGFNVVCNMNSWKDVQFKYLCRDENKNIHFKNNPGIEKGVKWIDKWFIKLTKKPHDAITKGFDYVSKKTVKGKYKKATKMMNKLDDLINQYKSKLPAEKRTLVEAKLAEIQRIRTNFTEDSLNSRLADQEKMMENLERDFLSKWRSYRKGFKNRFINKGDHVKTSLSFWAQDIMQPQKDKLQKEGVEVVEKLFNGDSSKKGLYNEIFEIFEETLGKENTILMKRRLKNSNKNLKKANFSECNEYFDKKRDLMLGGAPTDVVTSLFGLGACGVAVGAANDKDERNSRLVTTGIPVVVGLITSLISTAKLLSSATGLILGGVTGLGANFIGNKIDKHILGNNDEEDEKSQEKDKNKEAKNV